MKKILVAAVLAILLGASLAFAQETSSSLQTQSSAVPDNPPFRNPSLSIAQRVDDMVSRMTLEEKVSQMVYAAPGIPRLGIPPTTAGQLQVWVGDGQPVTRPGLAMPAGTTGSVTIQDSATLPR